jgi:hypothetical protein
MLLLVSMLSVATAAEPTAGKKRCSVGADERRDVRFWSRCLRSRAWNRSNIRRLSGAMPSDSACRRIERQPDSASKNDGNASCSSSVASSSASPADSTPSSHAAISADASSSAMASLISSANKISMRGQMEIGARVIDLTGIGARVTNLTTESRSWTFGECQREPCTTCVEEHRGYLACIKPT